MATKQTNVARGVAAAIVLVLMGQQAVAAELARALYVPPPPLRDPPPHPLVPPPPPCLPTPSIWIMAEPSPCHITIASGRHSLPWATISFERDQLAIR